MLLFAPISVEPQKGESRKWTTRPLLYARVGRQPSGLIFRDSHANDSTVITQFTVAKVVARNEKWDTWEILASIYDIGL